MHAMPCKRTLGSKGTLGEVPGSGWVVITPSWLALRELDSRLSCRPWPGLEEAMP